MRAKRRWAAVAATVGLLAGSLGGGIAFGADAMKQGDAMKRDDAMERSAGDAMQQQAPAASDAAMSPARMTG